MIRQDGLVKVLDFGLAKLTEHETFLDTAAETLAQVETLPGAVMGTVTYMSPEQARGREVDHRSDIWSLGVVLYEMLAGRPPFNGETAMDTVALVLDKEPEALPHGASASGIALIVERALRKNRDDRYQTVGEMLTDLQSVKNRRDLNKIDQPFAKSERVTEILEPAITGRIQAWPQISKVGFMLMVLLVTLIVVAGIYLVSFRNTNTSQNTAGSGRSPAYDLYIRGKVKAGSDNREEVEGAIKILEQAVSIDPNYAEAYATLAVAYNTKSFQFASESERKQLNENAEVAVEKALALNPDLAEGHFARAVVLWTHAKRFPHEQAIQEYKRALALNPNLDEAHHRLSMVYSHIGFLDEAQRELKTALALNPNNTPARFRASVYDYYQGKYEEALATLKTVPSDVSRALVSRVTADTLLHLGRTTEAEALVEDYLRSYPEDEGGNVTSVKAILLAKAGKEKEAQKFIERAIEIGQGFGHFHHTAYNIATAYAIMNKPDEALRWLQNAADDGFPCYSYFEIDHDLDNLRKDPRFIDFMTKGKIHMDRYRAIVNG
jgi:tetratricopeptide (TPR) repeat protein